MCGLFGVLSTKKLNDRKKFLSCLNLLKHRGPDAQGTFFDENIYFGHNRLSIIDVSKKANQPMYTKANDYTLIYNGELYNYQILKKQLIKKGYKFFSNSDTEVVLNSIREWGVNIIKKFDGMFAFALWNIKKKNYLSQGIDMELNPYITHSIKIVLFFHQK